MYVCICKGITDDQLRCAVQRGAHCMRSLNEGLGIATECGQCSQLAKQVLRNTLTDLNNNSLSLTHQAA